MTVLQNATVPTVTIPIEDKSIMLADPNQESMQVMLRSSFPAHLDLKVDMDRVSHFLVVPQRGRLKADLPI